MNDSFSILGLPPTAKRGEIVSAYRRLAKTWHPDLTGGDAGKFHQIREACDRLLEARPPDSQQKARYRFFNQLAKKPKPKPMRHPPEPVITKLQVTLQDLCRGAVRQVTLPDGCAIDLHIAKGHDISRKLRISRPALAGEPSEFLIQLEVKADPDFMIKGRDFHHDLLVPLWTLRTGGKSRIKTPTGALNVQIPILSSPKSKLRIAEKGLPANGQFPAGDLVLHLKAESAIGLVRALEQFSRTFTPETKSVRRT